jgi:hypothetical protein
MLPKISNHLSIVVLEFDARAVSEMLPDHGGHTLLSSRHALSRKRSVKQSLVTMLHIGNLQCPQSSDWYSADIADFQCESLMKHNTWNLVP